MTSTTQDKHITEYNKTKKHFGEFTILKAGTRGFYDVFQGNTWENYSRVHFDKKSKSITEIEGQKLKEKLTQVAEIIKDLNKGK